MVSTQEGCESIRGILYTPVEDFYNAYLNSGAVFISQRVCSIEAIVAAAGEHIRPYLAYLPRLTDLI